MTKNEKEKKNEIYVTISSKVGWMQVNWNQSYSFAKKTKFLHKKSIGWLKIEFAELKMSDFAMTQPIKTQYDE